MKNARFHWLLEQARDERGKRLWTIERISKAIYCGRAHVNEVLNNKPHRGAQTRPKLIAFFKQHFSNWTEILESLGWREDGCLIPHGTSHVGQTDLGSCALDSARGKG